MATTLGRIFDSGVANDIEVLYDEVQNSKVLEPVGTTAFQLKGLSIEAKDSSVKVFDLAATLDATSSANVSINAPGTPIAPFDASSSLSAPSGSSYAILAIGGELSAGTSGSVSNIPLTVSASASSSFQYDHYLPVAATDVRATALARLVAGAQLPQFANLTSLKDGEVTRFQATLNFDLGIKGTYGTSFDVDRTIALFEGLSATFKATVQASIEASLGWTLYDDMDLVVGRAQTNTAGWVRIHLDRSRKNSFTAGATFALEVNYDASSLASALEKAFQMSPLPRAISTLQTVQKLTWDQVKTDITDRASNDLIELIAGTGWKEKAANSAEVTQALADVNKVVGIYNSVDTKVQQLWASLLMKADLQEGSDLRKSIDTIAALDPNNPNLEQFLSPTAQKDLDLLESLSGKSIEQLLLGSHTSVLTAIDAAISLAKQLQRVITETPATITTALDKFADTHDIKAAMTWLAQNATSLDAIQKWGDTAIINLVSKAVNKSLGDVTPKELQSVQSWATKILSEWDNLTKKLNAAVKYLKGTLGFNASLEYGRASEVSALLDFELDPANDEAVKAVREQLPKGSVRDMLAALDAIDRSTDGRLPFTIRDSILTTRHTRTGATTVLLSLLGLQKLQKVTHSRVEEVTVRVADQGRTATFSGGFTQGITADGVTSECGAWISTDAIASTISESEPFATAENSMRLTFARLDTKSNSAAIVALQTLLDDLGFTQTSGDSVTAPAGSQTSFTLDMSLSADAVKLFATDDGEENWNKDYRNAAYRLIRDDMVTDRLASVGQPLGEVIAAVVATEDFAKSWTDNTTAKFVSVVKTKGFAVNGRTLEILNDQNAIIPPYVPIRMMITRRPYGLRALGSLRKALASASLLPRDLVKVAESAAETFADTSFPEWDNPMFNFWLVVARLARLAGQTNVLQNASGLATFRYRTSTTAAYSDPQQWSLTKSVGVPVKAIQSRKLFPFA